MMFRLAGWYGHGTEAASEALEQMLAHCAVARPRPMKICRMIGRLRRARLPHCSTSTGTARQPSMRWPSTA